jgi:hypothetical protein
MKSVVSITLHHRLLARKMIVGLSEDRRCSEDASKTPRVERMKIGSASLWDIVCY